MAIGQFKNANKANVGIGVGAVAPTDGGDGCVIYKAPTGEDSYLIELDIASLGVSGVQIDVRIWDASENASVFVVKAAPVPVGSALSVVDNQKIVLESEDELIVECVTDGEFVDVVSSLLENVNG
jgi:hypothetical protein